MTDFFIADTHFGHKNIIKFCNEHRPFETIEEHDAHLISQWNSVVSDGDRVFILGDFFLGGYKNYDGIIEALTALKGRKILIQGNHDLNHKQSKWLEMGMDEVHSMYEYKGCLLTHIPVDSGELRGGSSRGRWLANIHGHLHDKGNTPELNYTGRFCVSAECVNLTPRTWQEVWSSICDVGKYANVGDSLFVQSTLEYKSPFACFWPDTYKRIKGKTETIDPKISYEIESVSPCGEYISIYVETSCLATLKSKNFVGVKE